MIDAFVERVEFESKFLKLAGFLVPEGGAFALDDELVLIFGDGLSELIVDRNVHRLRGELIYSEDFDEFALVLPHLEVATVSFFLLDFFEEIDPRKGHFCVQ